MTVSVDQVHGVAGLLVPGDRVNLMVVLDQQLAALTAGQPGQPQQQNPEGTVDSNQTVRYLYQNVEVLAIGQTAAADAGATEAPDEPAAAVSSPSTCRPMPRSASHSPALTST